MDKPEKLNDCKDLETKTCRLYTLSQEACTTLMKRGVRCLNERIVCWNPQTWQWELYPKHLLLLEWYIDYGHDLKPSEIERELFPAVVAWFQHRDDARVWDTTKGPVL